MKHSFRAIFSFYAILATSACAPEQETIKVKKPFAQAIFSADNSVSFYNAETHVLQCEVIYSVTSSTQIILHNLALDVPCPVMGKEVCTYVDKADRMSVTCDGLSHEIYY